MEWFIAIVVVVALGLAAAASAGRLGEMSGEPVRDTFRQDLAADRMLTADDLAALRFGVTLRGYAMDQVDEVLDRLQTEIRARDTRIAELTGVSAQASPVLTTDRIEPVDATTPISVVGPVDPSAIQRAPDPGSVRSAGSVERPPVELAPVEPSPARQESR